MNNLDLDDIFRKNPHLDPDSLDALRRYLDEVPFWKTRYRLAPYGSRRATTVTPDSAVQRSRHPRSYPGF